MSLGGGGQIKLEVRSDNIKGNGHMELRRPNQRHHGYRQVTLVKGTDDIGGDGQVT